MTKVLVTGSKGQLGSEINDREKDFAELNFTFVDIEELDLTNFKEVEKYFSENNFDFCINCAAYTAVDKAEDEMKTAMLINHKAVENLAKVCSANNIFLIHLSTDYVFDGKNYKPYNETDKPSPNTVYGKSKLKGEKAVSDFANKWIIIRTSWLYSVYGHNFVKTILNHSIIKDELRVVSDQVGTPTNAADLAEFILTMIPKTEKFNREIYHFSNHGVCSWYDFAKAIVEEKELKCKVLPIESKDFPARASRPLYSVMNKTKLSEDFGFEIPHWRDSLKKVLKNLD